MPVLYSAECRNIFLTSITSWYRETTTTTTTTTTRIKLCFYKLWKQISASMNWMQIFSIFFFKLENLIRQEETVEQEEKQEYWHETNDNE